MSDESRPVRLSIDIEGRVQGVGFRPLLHRMATARDLSGFVRNQRGGVHCEVEGAAAAVAAFVEALRQPLRAPLRIDRLSPAARVPTGVRGFRIESSEVEDCPALDFPLDAALCTDCRRELLDPGNRRFRHPFISCTVCGPRWSLLSRLPFDRARTSMAAFPPCAQCQGEYEDPADRRFHAQTICCPDCGPQLALWSERGNVIAARADALRGAVAALRRGEVVAVKGMGGFHLMVDAHNVEAINRLRLRKGRPHKPLAVMFEDLDSVRTCCEVDAPEAALLQDASTPIVLLRSKATLPDEVAPDNPYLGAMLAYTPLHLMLLCDFGGPLVATSGNLGGEPLCHDEAEVVERLEAIADCYLVHDRPILNPVDDSVGMVAAGRPLYLRCARGIAPQVFELGAADEWTGPMLALGGQLKNTLALARGGTALMSPHLGDLGSAAAEAALRRMAKALPDLAEASVAVVVHDRHPDYRSTRVAQDSGLPTLAVQHHHAHVAAVMAEHGLDGEVLGLAWDGNGLGDDGASWGGEFLLADRAGYRRVASFREFPLPGGERALREPRRSAQGLLHEAGLTGMAMPWLGAGLFSAHEQQLLEGQLRSGVNCPRTSSVGRLFDAVAALLGLLLTTSFEGQAAMALQFAAERHRGPVEPFPYLLLHDRTPTRIDWAPMLTALIEARAAGEAVAVLAARFHCSLAVIAAELARSHRPRAVVLSGGCFQNRLLLESVIGALQGEGHAVYWPLRLPPNDAALSLGQLTVARAQRRIAPCA